MRETTHVPSGAELLRKTTFVADSAALARLLTAPPDDVKSGMGGEGAGLLSERRPFAMMMLLKTVYSERRKHGWPAQSMVAGEEDDVERKRRPATSLKTGEMEWTAGSRE